MKLLLENWRKFILFENIETASRLSIFDFDETIAFTEGHVNVIDKETGEEFQTTSQEHYDELQDSDRYEFDFSPLDDVHNATENPNITSILRNRLQDSKTQVIVLTARAAVSVDDIHRTMQMFDNPIETSNIIIIGVEGGNKGEYLRDTILSKYDNIREIEFYDDSENNISDMSIVKDELISNDKIDNLDLYHVKDGIPNKEFE